jgi:glutamate-ammonia-ligase adenylyltransferase
MRLRPTGRSGSLVVPLAEFRRYYADGNAQLWERQALTRARVVYGNESFGQEVMQVVHEAAYGPGWDPKYADEIRHMRERLEASRSDRDLKRGFGGIVDIEFIVQMFLLKHGKEHPEIRSANVRSALNALQEAQLITLVVRDELLANYDFLRRIESRLRMVHNFSQDELPEGADDLEKLARRLEYTPEPSGKATVVFLEEMEGRTRRTRQLFEELLYHAGRGRRTR